MSRTIQLTALTSDIYELQFGFSQSELSTFSIQMWITRTGKRSVDLLSSISLGFCSFMGGNIYLHNDDTTQRCTLFGEKKDMKVGFVINEQPNVNKILESLGIHTDDDQWEVESVTIAPDQNYPDGQYSIIPTNKFKKRGGVLWSEFQRNMKSSSSTISYLEALSGDALRGKTAYVVLKNTSTDKVELWELEINLTKSR